MNFNGYYELIPFGVVSAILAFAIASFCFGYRHLRETTGLAIMMISVGIWSLTGVFELISITAPQKIFWSKISYLGISTIGPSYLIFSLYYSSLNKYVTKTLIWILSLFSLSVFILALTNDFHRLIWSKTIPLVNQYGLVVIYTHGMLLKIITLIIYFLLVVSTIMIFRSTYLKKKSYPISTTLILIAIIIPWIANFYYMFGKSIIPGFDITPIMFSLSGLLFLLGILLFKTLNVMPFTNKLLFDSMKGAVLFVNKEQRVTSINKAMKELLNNENPSGLLLEDILPEVSKIISQYNEKKPFSTEITLNDKYFELQITPILINDRNTKGYIIILRNITDRKNHEEELLLIQRKLTRLNDNQNKILSVISHDFRGSVGNVKAFLELILTDPTVTDDERHGILSALLKDSTNNLQLLDNLLSWARTKNEKIIVQSSVLNLFEVVDVAINRNLISAHNKNIEIRMDIHNSLMINADKTLLATVLYNLISNAIKFSFENSSVNVSATSSEGFALIKILDYGMGIPSSLVESLFEINSMNSSLGTKGEKGTGFGLFLCKEFVDLMGGTISVSSKPGYGSSFVVSIPLAGG